MDAAEENPDFIQVANIFSRSFPSLIPIPVS
jgi:hypothetical protein